MTSYTIFLRKITLIPFFILTFFSLFQAQKFDNESVIRIAGVNGNQEIRVQERWEQIWEKTACCGESLSGRKYGYKSELSKEEQKLASDFGHEMIFGMRPQPFQQQRITLEQVAEELAKRQQGGDNKISDNLFDWTSKEDEKGKAEGLFAGMMDPGDKGELSFTSPECDCLTVSRYQLFVKYILPGNKIIDQYVHKYKNEQSTSPGNCDKPECKNEQETSAATYPDEASHYPNGFPRDLEYELVGTGKTTEDVMNFIVHNPTDRPIELPVTRAILRRVDDSQAYEVRFPGDPSPSTITVEPGETDTIPAIGDCLDVRKPPLAEGASGPEITDVITPANAPTFPFNTETLPEGFTRIDPTKNELAIVYPGTEELVPYEIDFGTGIEPAASLIFEMEDAMDETFEEMLDRGEFDHLPLPESRIIAELPQLIRWYVYAILQGEPYTEQEFSERLDSQLVNNINMPISSLPEETQEQWSGGKTDIFSMVVFASKESKVVQENVYDIDHQETGPVFQDNPCDWRRICVDIFVMARQDGSEFVIKPTYTRRGRHYNSGSFSVPASAFSAASGAMANLTDQESASLLTQNINQMFDRINTIYEPCCIWFELNNLYAIDPRRARVSRDGTTLDGWVDMYNMGEDIDGNPEPSPEMHVDREIPEDDGMSFLGAAQSFVQNHSGLEENDCLKMFLGPRFAGEDAPGGKANVGGDFSVIPQSRINPGCSGCVPAHELGHNLGIEEHDESEYNMMNESEPQLPGGYRPRPEDINVTEDQCDEMEERADRIGEELIPPAPTEPENEGPGLDDDTPSSPGPGDEGASPDPSEPGPEPVQPDPEEQVDDEEDDEEECECPDPEAETTGESDMQEMEEDQTTVGESVVSTCCADVTFNVELMRTRRSRHDFDWSLEYEITDPDCFVSFEINRFYVDNEYNILLSGYRHEMQLRISSLEFEELSENHFILNTEDGYDLDFRSIPGGENMSDREQQRMRDQFNRDRQRNNERDEEDRDPSYDLSEVENENYWRVLIGGIIKCKDGDEIRAFPFHFIFERRHRIGDVPPIALSGGALELPESAIAGSTTREIISRETIYLNGSE